MKYDVYAYYANREDVVVKHTEMELYNAADTQHEASFYWAVSFEKEQLALGRTFLNWRLEPESVDVVV